MHDDDEFQRGIPAFLRRPAEPWPENPMFMTVGTKAPPPAADRPAKVVDIRPRAQEPAASARAQQGALARTFPAPPTHAPAANEDAPFQVTLPREVIRQIRSHAAEAGTTQRAVVLRALRAAGFAVPAGVDVDRGACAARRR